MIVDSTIGHLLAYFRFESALFFAAIAWHLSASPGLALHLPAAPCISMRASYSAGSSRPHLHAGSSSRPLTGSPWHAPSPQAKRELNGLDPSMLIAAADHLIEDPIARALGTGSVRLLKATRDAAAVVDVAAKTPFQAHFDPADLLSLQSSLLISEAESNRSPNHGIHTGGLAQPN